MELFRWLPYSLPILLVPSGSQLFHSQEILNELYFLCNWHFACWMYRVSVTERSSLIEYFQNRHPKHLNNSAHSDSLWFAGGIPWALFCLLNSVHTYHHIEFTTCVGFQNSWCFSVHNTHFYKVITWPLCFLVVLLPCHRLKSCVLKMRLVMLQFFRVTH